MFGGGVAVTASSDSLFVVNNAWCLVGCAFCFTQGGIFTGELDLFLIKDVACRGCNRFYRMFCR
jgi:hypothetical protein